MYYLDLLRKANAESFPTLQSTKRSLPCCWYITISSTTTVLRNNVSQASSQYSLGYAFHFARLTWIQFRASRTAYLASVGAVGTVIAETSNSEDQGVPVEVVAEAPVENAIAVADPVPTVAELEPTRSIFPHLPEKVDPCFSR